MAFVNNRIYLEKETSQCKAQLSNIPAHSKRYIFIILFDESGLFNRNRKHAKVHETFQLVARPHFIQTSSVTSNYSLGIFVH